MPLWVGLINGPLFRKFTYRQVAMFGSLLVGISLFLCRFCDTFWGYMILYSAFYGSGIGITQSSNALALNTYFKDRRRIATGLSWSTTALGPIVWPYIIVALNDYYGMEGTVLIFAGFALHAFMCSLLLQPVEWHTKFRDMNPESAALLENGGAAKHESGWAKVRRKVSLISSQYLHNEDDPIHTGYEITDPGTPMMIKCNDGWYSRSHLGSRMSLASTNKSNRNSLGTSIPMSTRPSFVNLTESKKGSQGSSRPISNRPSYTNLPEYPGRERSSSTAKRKISQTKPTITEEAESDLKNEENHHTPQHEKEVLKEAVKILKEYKEHHQQEREEVEEKQEEKEEAPPEKEKLSIWRKITIFFDFDLFKDPIYVNLMLGLTIANFAELNFSILTPMVLKEFNFAEYETATFMSLLGATDIVVRFFIPFIADKIGWENKTFFLIGVIWMALGRIILVHTQTYYWSLLVAIIIGAGKGLRTIFIALVIPSYVPLEKLPAASGLQLATSGLLFILLGPVVGWIREAVNNYVITLHLLNICTYATAIAWIAEDFCSRKKKSLAEAHIKPKPTKSFKK
ncbi:uncharacterized protein LOC132705324 isoform X2 [Cylas formicarius]|uniref:uncharacterized protein LOC132705324 isoform X2 n=1 Tax=Cylas formicarius TaxID=197179 RepID=UPI002958B053|nr:uncharacterized protein LOC132705324 isoform X2 [Cylas formicarius]